MYQMHKSCSPSPSGSHRFALSRYSQQFFTVNVPFMNATQSSWNVTSLKHLYPMQVQCVVVHIIRSTVDQLQEKVQYFDFHVGQVHHWRLLFSHLVSKHSCKRWWCACQDTTMWLCWSTLSFSANVSMKPMVMNGRKYIGTSRLQRSRAGLRQFSAYVLHAFNIVK